MKKIFVMLLIFSIIFSFSGCNKSDLKSYRDSIEKTDTVTKGQMEETISMNFDFNTENLTNEQMGYVKYFKIIEGKMNTKFDVEEEKLISRNYFNIGGLGFDLDLYINGEEGYLQMPIIEKYIDLNDSYNKSDKEELETTSEFITQDSKEKIKKKWGDILQEDNVFSGKDTIMDSPNGEVKVKEYTIDKVEDDKLKEFALYAVDIVFKDKKFRRNLDDKINQSENDENITSNDFFEIAKEAIDRLNIENFNYVAYADKDGYLVKESVEIDMTFNNGEKMHGANFMIGTKLWDIGKDQEFDFPEINKENILKESEMDENMPFIFENLIDKE